MKRLVLIPILLLMTLSGYAQLEEEVNQKSDFWERIYIGGNFGLQFGNITQVEVSPIVGYRFTNTFSAGFGVTYQYYKIDYTYNGRKIDFKTNIYGGRIFARKNLTEQFFAYTEYESLNLEYVNRSDNRVIRDWVPAFFIGGGFYQPISRRVGFNIIALYNVIHDDMKSPYNSPLVIRVGITGGF